MACTPIELQTDVSFETAFPTITEIAETPLAPTEIPTLTPDEKVALDKALEFLGERVTEFEFQYIKHVPTDVVNTYVVNFRQVYNDIPVATGSISVFVEDSGKTWSSESYYPNIYLPSLTPIVSLDDVIANAIQVIGIQGDFNLASNAELEVYPLGLLGEPNQIYVLAWVFSLNTDCPLGTWAVTANAYDGELLFLTNVRESFLPIVSDCPTPLPLPSVTPAPYTPMPTATLSNYPPPAVTEAPPTVEATATSEAYPPVSSEIAPTPTEESTPVSTLTP